MTTSLQVLKSDFWRFQGQQWSSTATGGSVNSLVDTTLIDMASEAFPTHDEGRQIRMTSGASSGDLRQVADTDRSTGTLYPNRAFSSTGPTAADTYELWGNAIYGGQPLTDLFNDVMRRLKPIDRTQVTIVTNQQIYDISSLGTAIRDDILNVWLYLMDPANLAPYYPTPLWFDVWEGSAISGTSTMTLRIRPLTQQTNLQLWVEYRATLTPFTNDTSTIDAKYRDWIVWEAIYQFASRMLESTSRDNKVWAARKARAGVELMTLRQRFVPKRPIKIQSPFGNTTVVPSTSYMSP